LRNALSLRLPSALFTCAEAAIYIDRAERTVRNLASAGQLHACGRGRSRSPLFTKAELDRFLTARASEPAPSNAA